MRREEDLEVDGEQGEEGTKGSKEKKVEGLGNVHLILDDLDRAPETLDRISSCLFSFNAILRGSLDGISSYIINNHHIS